MGEARLISDLSTVQPQSALSDGVKAGHWRVCSYACQDIKGKLLYASAQDEAPAVTLPLGLTGWHRVIVGLWGELESIRYGANGNRLKLSGAPSFRPLVRQTSSRGTLAYETIEEAELTCADLTGQDLVIGGPPAGSPSVTSVAYVRCEPLTDAEARQIAADRDQTETRRLISYNDGVSYCGRRSHWDRGDLWEMIEAYRHSDIRSLYWGLIGDEVYFPTKTGTMLTGREARWCQSLADRHINPLVTAMEYAHQLGLEFYVYQRMGAWQFPFPAEDGSEFVRAHPEFLCLTREGVPIGRMSYAFDEVRRHQIDLLAEVAAYGVDGIDLNFMRGPVFVFYEEPLVSGFKKEYGQDPRQLDEWDQQWLEYRRWPMTRFVRDLRQQLDAVGTKLGKRIALSAVTLPTALGNLYYGLDVETWVKEGLIDRLVPWGNVRGMPPVDLDYYMKLTEGTGTTVWPHLFIFRDASYAAKPGPKFVRDALKAYDAGVAGLAMWDLVGFDPQTVLGPHLRRMGHIDEMRAALTNGAPDEAEPVVRKLERLGKFDMKVFSAPTTHRERLIPGDYPKHMYMWPG